MIVFHIDVMLARRKMSLTELSERVGITMANLKGTLDAGMESLFSQGAAESARSAAAQGATEALLSMGFTSAEAEVALKGAPEGAGEGALQLTRFPKKAIRRELGRLRVQGGARDALEAILLRTA